MTDVPHPQQQPEPQQREHPTPQPREHPKPQPEPQQADDFAARTSAAEALPLPDRADAFAALHDDLRTRLESGQAPQGHSSGRAAGASQVWGSARGDGGTGG